MKAKFIIIIIAVLIVGLFGGVVIDKLLLNKNGNTIVDNDKAEEKKDEKRFITIINNTNEIINEVHIFVGDGTEINHASQSNPNETSFSIEIPKEYYDYSEFTVVLIDNYGFKYINSINNINDFGRYEIVISKDNYVEQDGDLWKKIEKWFNNLSQ